MALPLPRVIPDVGPGGPLVTAMGGMNALANNMHLRKINQIKAQYAPITTQAEAASKLAYANLMGPQFVAKLLQDAGAKGNLSDAQLKSMLQMTTKAGMGQGNGINSLNQLLNQEAATMNNKPSNPLSWIVDKLKDSFQSNPNQAANSLNKMSQPSQNVPHQGGNGLMNEGMQPEANEGSLNNINDAELSAYDEWLRSPEGKTELEKGEMGKYPTPKEALSWQVNRQSDQYGKNNTYSDGSYGSNEGKYKGDVKQGEEGGKYRAEALNDIGKSQLGLSNSGAVLNRMAKIVKNPVFQDMRSKIPYFQDKQLNYLMKNGTPEQKKLIGDFITTAESFIASTVQGFSGKPLVREFDLAQRQKITPSDPVHVAEGKLRASIALHDIAEKKNQIISGLLKKGINEADAVEEANKKVDVSDIERQTEELLRDKPTEEDINYMAKKRNISTQEVRKQLKARGIL